MTAEEVQYYTQGRGGGVEGQSRVSNLALFDATGNWHSEFVIAPPALVEAQNKRAVAEGRSGAGWAKVEPGSHKTFQFFHQLVVSSVFCVTLRGTATILY